MQPPGWRRRGYSTGRLCCFKKDSLSQYPRWSRIFPLTTWKNPQPRRPRGVPPLQDCPLSILKQVFHNGGHLRGGKFRCEHLPDGRQPADRLVGHLMVDRLLVVQACNRLHIVGVKGVHPPAYDFLWPQYAPFLLIVGICRLLYHRGRPGASPVGRG